jgi:ribonuclease Z
MKLLIIICCLLCTEICIAQEFDVTLLGTGKPAPEMERFGPATLVEVGGEKFLFDCGRGASQRLWQLKIPLGRVSHIFLTHLHSDHTVGLPDIWLTSLLMMPFGRRDTILTVHGPGGTSKMMEHLTAAYEWDIKVRHDKPGEESKLKGINVQQGVVYENQGIKITAFDVDHGEHLQPALGYRIDYKGHSVVISGDTRYSENLIRYARGADVIIHEVIAAKDELLKSSALARQVVGLHTQPEEAAKVFNAVKPKLAVYTHIVLFSSDPKIPAPTLAELADRTKRGYNGRFELGVDLMKITISDNPSTSLFPGR